MEYPRDDRPMGWGCCDECSLDCEEDDYNQMTRISLHRTCERRCADCGATNRLTAMDGEAEVCVPCWHKRQASKTSEVA